MWHKRGVKYDSEISNHGSRLILNLIHLNLLSSLMVLRLTTTFTSAFCCIWGSLACARLFYSYLTVFSFSLLACREYFSAHISDPVWYSLVAGPEGNVTLWQWILLIISLKQTTRDWCPSMPSLQLKALAKQAVGQIMDCFTPWDLNSIPVSVNESHFVEISCSLLCSLRWELTKIVDVFRHLNLFLYLKNKFLFYIYNLYYT